MRIGLLKETDPFENRVALVPTDIKNLAALDYEIYVEENAGINALFCNEDYKKAGAKICQRREIFKLADIITGIGSPRDNELKKLQKFSTIIATKYDNKNCPILQKNELSFLALNYMPRLSNLQNMDILSSQDMLGGYACVYHAASTLKKILPLTITSAASLNPAAFLVIGIGIFGLSALATAKKLGATVYAYDINPEAAEMAKSVGAKFINLSSKEKMLEFLPKIDVLICSAFSHNKPAVKIIDENSLKILPQGSVIIDAATKYGGNVEGAKLGEKTEKYNSTIFGYTNWASLVPYSASIMLSKNITNLISGYFQGGRPDYTSEVIEKICLCKNGKNIT